MSSCKVKTESSERRSSVAIDVCQRKKKYVDDYGLGLVTTFVFTRTTIFKNILCGGFLLKIS